MLYEYMYLILSSFNVKNVVFIVKNNSEEDGQGLGNFYNGIK